MIMTVFLWHLTALLIAVVIAYPLGFPQFEGGTVGWWLTRPAWIAILCIALAPLVFVFSRYERPRFKLNASPAPQLPVAVTVVGISLLIIGMAGFAQGGFAGVLEPVGTDLGLFEANPLLSAFHMAIGLMLLRTGSRVAVGVASAALVGVGALEAFPLASDMLSVIPITGGNAVLHLACGTALSVFGRNDEERRTN
jgi:hypothetical protein